MGTDNTKRPRRRWQLPLRYHGQSRLRAGPRNTVGSCMWEGIELLIGCSVCVQRAFTSGSATFSDAAQSEEGNPVIGLESLRCRCYIAWGRLMCVDISCSCLLQSGWPVVFLRGCGLVGWCGHQHGDAYHSCGEIVPTCWRSLRGSIVGFRVWLLLMDTSAAWNRTLSTKLVQRNDACPACFAARAGKMSNVVISPTLSLLPTSSACLRRTVSNVYSVNDAVFVLRSCEVKPSSVAFTSCVCCERADRGTSRVVSCPFSALVRPVGVQFASLSVHQYSALDPTHRVCQGSSQRERDRKTKRERDKTE